MRFLFLFFLLLLVAFANAQIGQNFVPTVPKASQFTPVTPAAAAFQKFGDLPVDLSSGLVKIDIPLSAISLNEFEWPISISYHSSGNKVGDLASNIGLGWVLNGISMISAKAIGPSDLTTLNLGDSIRRNLTTGGNWNLDGCTYFNIVDQDYAETLSSENGNGFPDIFYLNSPLINAKFFIQGDSGYTMPKSNIKIKLNRAVNINNFSWEVVDDSGNKYIFDKVTSSASSYSCEPGQIGIESQNFYLTKVITYHGETIRFVYSLESSQYTLPEKETRYVLFDTNCAECTNKTIPGVRCQGQMFASEYRLDSIIASNGSIIALDYITRLDITGFSRLSALKTFYKKNNVVKAISRWNFNSGYFGTSQTNYRLKLESVASVDQNGTEASKYLFTYNSVQLPSRLSFAVDSAGYFNNQTGNSTFLPQFSNRSRNITYAQASILTKIQYPTGGTSEFTYENNMLTGGLRLQKIIDKSLNGTNDKIRKYVYADLSESINDVFAKTVVNYFALNTQVSAPVVQCSNNDPLCEIRACSRMLRCTFIMHSSSPQKPILESYLTYRKYNWVKEIYGDNGENGMVEHFFELPLSMNGESIPYYLANLSPYASIINKYRKKDGVYQIIEKTETKHRVINPALNDFLNPSDVREKFKWGIEVEKIRGEMSVNCTTGGGVDCYVAHYSQRHFKLVSTPLFILESKNIIYSETPVLIDSMVTITKQFYTDISNVLPTRLVTYNSKKDSITKWNYYPTQHQLITQINAYNSIANDSLIKRNRISSPILFETYNGIKRIEKVQVSNKLFSGVSLPDRIRRTLGDATLYSDFDFVNYNSYGKVTELMEAGGLKTSFVHNEMNVTAKVVNAGVKDIFFDGFEELSGWSTANGGSTNDLPIVYDPSRFKTGRYSGRFTNTSGVKRYCHSTTWLSINNSSTRKYKYSGWVYSTGTAADIYLFMKKANETAYYSYVDYVTVVSSGSWKYVEKEFVVPADVRSISLRIDINSNGTVWFDDLRLHPADAQMTTFTYDPLIGITSITDINNNQSIYEYDLFNRLYLVKDKDGNIVNRICYNYSGQVVACDVFYSDEKSGVFTRNNCSSGGVGSSVTYVVPANTYSSNISKADANQKAQNDVNANGQSYANLNGSCTYPNVNLYVTNTVNMYSSNIQLTNASTGLSYYFYPNYGFNQMVGTIPPGTYHVTMSVSDFSNAYYFSIMSCGYYGFGQSYTFFNVPISGTCNQLEISF